MTKLLLTICILTSISFSCNQATNEKDETSKKVQQIDTTKFTGLHGTWVRHNKEGFTLIEIKDTSNIFYYQFADRKAYIDTITTDRYWYYKSKATLGYWDSSAIWISTDKFRFDYRLKDDTLIEFDKMGNQGKFIKVYTDEEKAFKEFNAADLKGRITSLTKVEPLEFFVLDNIEWQYSFTSIATKLSNSKTFSDIAAIGDSVIKPAYADTLTCYKKDTKQYFKFTFVRR
ncbi:MAG: hypothetical protein JST34_16445 [Bacteroidetes bacterium]|nr:hypothetical protein [Bacteroidota bacterium]